MLQKKSDETSEVQNDTGHQELHVLSDILTKIFTEHAPLLSFTLF